MGGTYRNVDLTSTAGRDAELAAVEQQHQQQVAWLHARGMDESLHVESKSSAKDVFDQAITKQKNKKMIMCLVMR